MNKTMMKLVVATEGMFFVCLILSFIYMAFTTGYEPHQLQSLDIKETGVITIILIVSSFTLWLAERNYKKGKIKSLKSWLAITILLGAIFLVGEGKGYWRLIHENITLGGSVFGTSFYTLTGFHGFHVFVGLIMLSIVLALAFLGDFNKPNSNVITAVGYYWHFVDIVWIVVFTVIYILPHFTNI